MKIITDFQIHSRFARATSKDITIENLEKWARIKGLNLLGTGDFQHPKWFDEINENLEEDSNGILWSKTKFPFFWQTEISLMYTQDGKGRRIHHLILAPNKDIAGQIIEALGRKGRLDYDGRPIFGFSSIELVDMMMSISKEIEIIPAHVWTPYFGLFGSITGFDSVEECFKEKSKYIHAIETGMSSTPDMNWMISSLDKYALVSNSDMHSHWPWRLGREANIFDIKLSYKNIINAIRTRKGFIETIETDPNYGKYHYDGHRNCNFSCSPEESRKLKNICPVCNKPLTIGVLNRVEQLADREYGFMPKDAVLFKKIIPLSELIA
ncbi:DNA helicase UvrD, partial [Candidatus Woesearchaeota archaeon]|nr:DNA helicase UvrD [Candidatus Woesearchaeota archaeon]